MNIHLIIKSYPSKKYRPICKKMILEDTSQLKQKTILILIFLFNLAIGIAELIIDLHYGNPNTDTCKYSISTCVVFCACVHIGAFATAVISYFYYNDDEKQISTLLITATVSVNTIYPIVVYYSAGSDCAATFQENYTHLWNILIVEVALFYASIGIPMLIVIYLCLDKFIKAIENNTS